MTSERDVPSADAADEAVESMLAAAGLEVYPEDVRRDVDDLLAAGQSLEPEARLKLIEAAKRGTRVWKLRETAELETVLFDTRRSRGEEAEAVATVVGIDVAMLRSIERGESGLASQPPVVVASWAVELGIDRTLVGDALRRSLGTRGAAPAYAGELTVRLDAAQEQFVTDVLSAYDERSIDSAG